MVNWKKLTFIELLYIIVFVVAILVGVAIFKLAKADNFTWRDLFFIIAFI